MLPCGHQTSTCSIHICKVNSCPHFKLMPLLRVPLKMTDNGGRRSMFHVSARLKECRWKFVFWNIIILKTGLITNYTTNKLNRTISCPGTHSAETWNVVSTEGGIRIINLSLFPPAAKIVILQLSETTHIPFEQALHFSWSTLAGKADCTVNFHFVYLLIYVNLEVRNLYGSWPHTLHFCSEASIFLPFPLFILRFLADLFDYSAWAKEKDVTCALSYLARSRL